MGTIVETETVAEATELLNRAYVEPADGYRRVYAAAKFDLLAATRPTGWRPRLEWGRRIRTGRSRASTP